MNLNTWTIHTKYSGPTESGRGARIIARTHRSGGRSVTVPYDHSARDPHLVAAEKLAKRIAGFYLSYTITEISGGPDGRVFEAVVS